MNLESIVRKLAKSDYYQFLYSRAKDLHNLRLFNNDRDFTGIQLLFLRWVEAYSILYQDLSMQEKYLSEEVIDDLLRAEAYLVYKQWKNKKENKERDKDDNDNKAKDVFNRSKAPSIVFTEE